MHLLNGFDGEWKGLNGLSLPPVRLSILQSLLVQTFGTDIEVKFHSRFQSKKNVVIRLTMLSGGEKVEQPLVAKMFIADTYDKEINMLRLCTRGHVRVPDILAARDGVILMEYVPGENLVDSLNRTFSKRTVELIANWYHGFHVFTQSVKGDSILRNFISTKEGLVGLDFEEAGPGPWVKDIGGICASMLDTRPVFDVRKQALVWHLLETYLRLRGISTNPETERMFTDEIADALGRTADRRRNPELLKLSQEVRDSGIPRRPAKNQTGQG